MRVSAKERIAREPVLTVAGPEDHDTPHRDRLLSKGWEMYLLAVVALAPIVVPSGPAQTAIVDVVNLVALAIVAGHGLLRLPRIELPFALPVLMVAIGSLLALTNAMSLAAGAFTLLQDLYLYLWFVLLVDLMSRDGDLRRVILEPLAQGGGSLWAARGLRAAATFYNPNMFADYLMLSLFVVLSLEGQVRLRYRAPSLALLALALLATKSNGGLISAAAGIAVWAVMRARATGQSPVRLAGAVSLALAVVLVAGWVHAEWNAGAGLLQQVQEQSFFGRMSHSSESRRRIWQNLERDVARAPLGIGPGNAPLQTLAIGDRERPDSFQSKEAHNDYLGYAVERGPLAFAGLLLAIAQAFARVAGARLRLEARVGGVLAAGVVRASLLGALIGTTLHSTVIEKLHFRHFWAVLAVACALTGAPGRGAGTPPAPARPGLRPVPRPRVAAKLGEIHAHG